jgi:predicted dehydrogenase/threonine dehydrogenase-like Zn-dependent dehydrogenase
MKQVVQNIRNGKTEILDVPAPATGPGTVLVRTTASVVSVGTERMVLDFAKRGLVGKVRSRPDLVRQMMEKARREGVLTAWESATSRLAQPMALGYSSSGVIIALGDGVSEFRIGERVACAGGGHAAHAEFASVPVNLLCKVPQNVELEEAAFSTLGAIALHGFRLSRAVLGENVAVVGLGLLGLLATQIAKAAGCRVFGIDLDPKRVKLARGLGADAAVTRAQAERSGLVFTGGRGFDAVLICADTAANDPVELAGSIACDRGRVVAVGAVGLNVPRKPYYEREIELIVSRSYGPGRYDPLYEEAGVDYPYGFVRWTENRNIAAFLELQSAGKVRVSPMITQRFPVEKAAHAYQLISAKGKKKTAFLGVLLTYASEGMPATSIPRKIEIAKMEASGETIRLGVLGAGNFAMQVALPAISRLPRVDKISVVSASGLSAQIAANRFGFMRAASNLEDVLNDSTIDAVGIFTRHYLHAAQAARALRSGKHVFCEKPLALSDDELRDVERAWKKDPSRVLMVGFNRRFAPMVAHLREQIARQGEPPMITVRVNAGLIPAGHWTLDPALGGGRILGEACHFVDLMCYLAGSLPTKICAARGETIGKNNEDHFAAAFEFAGGAAGSLVYTFAGDRTSGKERVEVFCGGRTMILDDFRTLEIWSGGNRQMERAWLRQDKGHRSVWEAFLLAACGQGSTPIPAEEIFGVTRATFELLRAVREG